MISALLLIFDPVGTWERIIRAHRSVAFILCIHLLPLLILAGAGEGFSLVHWGYTDKYRLRTQFTVPQAVAFEVVQGAALLIMLLAASGAVKGAGETFNARKTFAQALTIVAYGLGPVFLLRITLVFPGIQPWIPWAVGLILSLAVLYHGVPRVMTLDPTNAFGLYLATALILVLATGAVYMPAFLYLDRKSSALRMLLPG